MKQNKYKYNPLMTHAGLILAWIMQISSAQSIADESIQGTYKGTKN